MAAEDQPMDVRTLFGGISYNKALAREYGEKIEASYAGLLPRGLRYDKESVQSSTSSNDHVAEVLDNVEQLKASKDRLTAQAAKDERIATEIIGRLRTEDPRGALVLTMYYLRDGRDGFQDIADEIGYSTRMVYIIYAKAINRAQEIMDEMEDKDFS